MSEDEDEPAVTHCPPGERTPDDQIKWKWERRGKRRPMMTPKAKPTLSRSERPLKPTGERTYNMDWRRCSHCGFAYEPRQIGQRFCGDICAAAWHEEARAIEREDQRVGECDE